MRLTVTKPKGFSLAAATDFYAGFLPGSGMAAAANDVLTLAFRLDRTFDAVAVALEETGDAISLEVEGTSDANAVNAQVTRILGLDADGDAWRALGDRDATVRRLQREFPGFFTASKSSPYDAATWGVIAPRLAIPIAAKVKMEIARKYGDVLTLRDRVHSVFPSPRAVMTIDRVEGLANEKLARLKAVARAALDGELDADRLRARPVAEALAQLQSIRGVGPWTASHIYFRGAAPRDALPTIEPRVIRGWGAVAGVERPTREAFERAAESWRPFRMWVSILVMRFLSKSGGWNAPGLAKERAASIARSRPERRERPARPERAARVSA